jgi:hypothetical protein
MPSKSDKVVDALTLVRKPIKALKAAPYNPRKIDDAALSGLQASVERFGIVEPVVWNERTGYVVGGHQRLKALKRMGVTETEVVVVDLPEIEERALNVALNNPHISGTFTPDVAAIVEGIAAENAELVEALRLDLIVPDVEVVPPVEGLTDEDAVPDVAADPVTRPGDVWILGRHRVMCGDSTSVDAVEGLLDGENWGVAVIDPPYDKEDLYRDTMPPPQPGKRLIVMWDMKRFAVAPSTAIEFGWEPQYEFIWDCVQSWYTPNRPLARHKACGVFGDDPHFDTDRAIIRDGKDRGADRVVHNTRGASNYSPLDGAKHIATVEAFANTSLSNEHAHGKPVPWVEAILAGLGEGNILDLFLGSGTTVIAAEKLGRRCFGMEIAPQYCDVIVKRWQDFTGQRAILESTGEEFPR